MNSTCGVVGYHVRFTRERSSVRTRVSAFFIFSYAISDLKIFFYGVGKGEKRLNLLRG